MGDSLSYLDNLLRFGVLVKFKISRNNNLKFVN